MLDKKVIYAMAIFCGSLATVSNATEFSPDYDQSGTVNSVQEMLQIDTTRGLIAEKELLLERLGRKAGSPELKGAGQPVSTTNGAMSEAVPAQVKPSAEVPKAPVFDVLGIFGLGDNIFADVSINGNTVRFQRGHSAPLGYAKYPYRLSSIEVPCVKLFEQQTLFTVCMSNSGL